MNGIQLQHECDRHLVAPCLNDGAGDACRLSIVHHRSRGLRICGVSGYENEQGGRCSLDGMNHGFVSKPEDFGSVCSKPHILVGWGIPNQADRLCVIRPFH